jgi:hypothetical protein
LENALRFPHFYRTAVAGTGLTNAPISSTLPWSSLELHQTQTCPPIGHKPNHAGQNLQPTSAQFFGAAQAIFFGNIRCHAGIDLSCGWWGKDGISMTMATKATEGY